MVSDNINKIRIFDANYIGSALESNKGMVIWLHETKHIKKKNLYSHP